MMQSGSQHTELSEGNHYLTSDCTTSEDNAVTVWGNKSSTLLSTNKLATLLGLLLGAADLVKQSVIDGYVCSMQCLISVIPIKKNGNANVH